MRRVKIALTGLAIAGVATGGFLRWQGSSSRVESKALAFFQKGDGREAYNALVPLENHIPTSQLLLLQSYTLRENGLIPRSTQRLIQAAQALEGEEELSSHDKQRLIEIGLNLALNGYLSKEQEIFDQGLEIVEKIDAHEPWIAAFKALKYQKDRQFSLAGEWAAKAAKRRFLSNWMSRPFGHIFTKHWDLLIQARAKLEQGKTVSAQELISQIPLENPDIREQVKVLLALINIKEGEQRPVDLSLNYFKLALSRLKTVSQKIDSPFENDYDAIASAFSLQGIACLQAGLISDVDFYVGALSDWHDKNHLAALATKYINWLAGEEFSSTLPDLSSEVRLNALIQTPEWEDVLHTALVNKLEAALLEKRWDSVEQFWMFTSSSADSTPKLVAQLESTVKQFIDAEFSKLINLKEENADLVFLNISQLFPLLAQMESTEGNYQKFLIKLVDEAAALLAQTPINPICTRTFAMLSSSAGSPNPEQLLNLIKEKIARRFNQARSIGDMSTMAALFDVAAGVGVDAIPTYSKENIANMLADCRYQLDTGQITQAQDQLKWILKLDPKNSSARTLLGSSFFATGDYLSAADILAEIKEPSPDIAQILCICYLRSEQGPKAMALISKVRARGETLSDRVLLESGLYLAQEKQWKNALEQLQNIQTKIPDVWAYIMACSYKLGDSKGVWQSFNKLPTAMRGSRPITALALRSIDSPALFGIASSIMETALKLTPDKSVISVPVKDFLEKSFSPYELDLTIAAAHFLQGSKQDPARALELLKSTFPDQLDWRLQCEKALALVALGLAGEAHNELKKVNPQPVDEEHMAFWLVLSQVHREECRYRACEDILDKLTATLGSHYEISLERARLYFDTLRTNACLHELEPLLEMSSLETRLLYMKALVKMGKFQEAVDEFQVIAKLDHSAWAVWRSALILYPAYYNLGIAAQVPTRNLFELLKAEEKATCLQGLLSIGEKQLAISWGKQFENELFDSFEATFFQMQLALTNGNFLQARGLMKELISQKNLKLEKAMRVVEYLEIMSEDELLKEFSQRSFAISGLKDEIKNRPGLFDITQDPSEDNIEAILTSCMAYLAYARVHVDKKGSFDGMSLREVESIRQFCDNKRSDNGPIIFFLLAAEAQSLLNEPFLAEQNFKICLSATPSLFPALIGMSNLMIEAKAYQATINFVKKALCYFPKNPYLELQIARAEFELATPKISPNKPLLTPDFSKVHSTLESIMNEAPYLSQGYILQGRIAMFEGKWALAYEKLMLADKLKPGDKDLLTLLATTIEERIRQEGSSIEWQEQLAQIQKNLRIE